jgi:hypothetical protein
MSDTKIHRVRVSGAQRTLRVNCFALYACCSSISHTISASGYIQISRASDGEVLGYVRKTFNNITRYTYDTLDKALVVNLPASCSSGAFDLVPTNGPDAVHNNVGAVTGAYGFDFKPGRLG